MRLKKIMILTVCVCGFYTVLKSQTVFAQKIYEITEVNFSVDSGVEFFRTKSGSPVTGVIRSYHENGQLGMEGTFKNGKGEGVIKIYHENGQLRSETTYKNGLTNGRGKTYYKNGQLQSEGTFKNGKAEGSFKEYYPDGPLLSERTYENGIENGIRKVYDENGNLSWEVTVKNGKPEYPEYINDFANQYQFRGRGDVSKDVAVAVGYCIVKRYGVSGLVGITRYYQSGNYELIEAANKLVGVMGCDGLALRLMMKG